MPPRLSAAPRIVTERLVLRAHGPDDFEATAALWGDPETVRGIGGRAFSREECWWRLLRYLGMWPALGFGYWCLEERGSGACVGDVGFADFKRDMEPGFDGAPEGGWVLAPSVHGKGYATEAMAAACAWLDAERPDLAPAVCMIDPDNAPSIRVAEKLGFAEYARAAYHDSPVILYQRKV